MRKTRLILWLLIASAVAVVGAETVIRMIDEADAPPTPEQTAQTAKDIARKAITGEFSLVDQKGNPVTDKDFRGSWRLEFFGYTHCPDVCPTTLAVIGLVMDALGDDAAKVRPLFITVDPARDTPEVMAQFVSAFDSRIFGLTGSPEQIKAAAQSHHAYYAKAPAEEGGQITDSDYAMDHSAYLYLMDPDGVYADVFSPTDTPEEIAARIRDLINRNVHTSTKEAS